MSGEDIRRNASIGDDPNTSLGSELHQIYVSVLLAISENLYPSKEKLKNWARKFSIRDLESATHVLFQLDEKGIISVSDLSILRNFFETIDRYELVHTIDLFHQRDYAELNFIVPGVKKTENLVSSQDGNPSTAASATPSDGPDTGKNCFG